MTAGWRPERVSGLRALLRGRNVEPDIDEEFASHLLMREEQLMAEGLSEAEASAEARRMFGEPNVTRAACVSAERRRVGRGLRAEALWSLGRDVRMAIRVWRRAPTLSALAVAALAIGTGAAAAVFSIANGVLLTDLPYPEPDRLAYAHASSPGSDQYGQFSHAEFVALRDGLDESNLVAYSMARQAVTGAGMEPAELSYARVTRGFFETLGRPPLHGRTPAIEEYDQGLPVAVLAYATWVGRFGEDAAIVGRSIDLAGTPHTVIGIMPSQFAFPEYAALWRPLTLSEREDDDREHSVAVRLGTGVSLEQGGARLDRVFAAFQQAANARDDELRIAWLASARATLVRSVRTPLFLLLGAAGLVLLVACVNVSNLLLAHAESRRDQTAMRQALGASKASLLRQHLAESLVLSTVGCALGLVVAWLTLPVLLRIAPDDTPRLAHVVLNGRVVAAMALAAMATTMLIGFLPAFRTMRVAPYRLAAAGRRFGAGKSRLLQGFVTAQVSLSTILVLGATLLGASFLNLMTADRGFTTEDVLVVPLSLSDRSAEAEGGRIATYERIVDQVRSVPGVRTAHLVYHSPIEGRGFNLSMLEPEGLLTEDAARASVVTVTPGYFSAAGIRLLEGRPFAGADDDRAPAVAIASESFARRLLPPGLVVGARFRQAVGSRGEPADVTIVGVVADIVPDPARAADPVLYLPFAQLPIPYAELLVRADTDAAGILPALRERIWAIDADVPLNAAFTMEQAVADAAASPRFYVFVVGLFAGLALLLAVAGVYGVTAYSVSQRVAEIGVRCALGADADRITRLFLFRGLRPVLLGVVVGLSVAAAASVMMRSLLFGVAPVEPLLYASVAAVLAAIGFAATALPARRAARVDPLEALRRE